MHPNDYAALKRASGGGAPSTSDALLLSVGAACHAIGVGRTKLYKLIANGQLTLVKIGTKSLITADSLQRFVAGLEPSRARSAR
jgi:excisionase family DNA binding protein